MNFISQFGSHNFISIQIEDPVVLSLLLCVSFLLTIANPIMMNDPRTKGLCYGDRIVRGSAVDHDDVVRNLFDGLKAGPNAIVFVLGYKGTAKPDSHDAVLNPS